ncbi:lectin-like domain-containing protein [Adhaeribacter radiodurans]|uniref:T9SS type A sorting domain-containing protein n=1 Tax=Adhaeribacter radiodurans TaxID=2745197 RepID=A0A7L7LDT0_9BACT|nr:T9SS type A sorting domain-containing protein [Adhaeribacter radiodurans]QMU30569.1 T9SS type A sorting domain-containing protein [Adhaeribacter radiodurans]
MKIIFAFLVFFCISISTIAQNFRTNGSATKVSDNEFQLTSGKTVTSGSVWSRTKIDLQNDFIIKAQVFLGDNEFGADGITFALQPLSNTALGYVGHFLGYTSITPSIAVEFDTWPNFEINDPAEDHIAFLKNGDTGHNTENNPNDAYSLDINIEDGAWHDVTFSWNASSHTLTVNFLSQEFTHTEDIVNSLFKASAYVYWGFTGATGSSDQRVRIVNTYFAKKTTMTLINADTDKDIKVLKDGDTLNLASLPALNLNIRANTSSTSGSVIFQLTGKQTHIQTENSTPFALYGNNKNDYSGWTPANGDYTLTATPYELKNGKGNKGSPLTIHFHVIYQIVNNLVLVNAETDQDIKTLENGEVIDLATLPTRNVNIRAITYPEKVGSVLFNLNNWLMVKENFAPYAIGGNKLENYRPWALPTGKHTLTVSPYELKNATGHKGQSYTVKFTVVDPLATTRISSADKPQNAIIVTEAEKIHLNAQPNPFTSSTTIHFSVPKTGYTTLQLYNSTGAHLGHLFGAVTQAGILNSLQIQSKELPNGIYMLRLTSGNQVHSFKLLLAR